MQINLKFPFCTKQHNCNAVPKNCIGEEALCISKPVKLVSNPKRTKTKWNNVPHRILRKLKLLSGNWTNDFKKDKKT